MTSLLISSRRVLAFSLVATALAFVPTSAKATTIPAPMDPPHFTTIPAPMDPPKAIDADSVNLLVQDTHAL